MPDLPDFISLSCVIKLDPAGSPPSVHLEESPDRFFVRLNLWETADSPIAIKAVKDPGYDFPLTGFPPTRLFPTYGLYCDTLAFPGTAQAGGTFRLSLKFTQDGKPCAFDVEPTATGTFSDASVSAGEIIHMVCKFVSL